jgi:hypothetical protein
VLGNAAGTLAPGASCTSNIYFVPTVAGGATVTAIYYGNFTQGRAGTIVSAEATAVSVTPTKLTFPNTTVGQTSAPMTISFTNAGSVALSIGVGWAGSEPYFKQTNTCQPSVPANTTCTFTVTFTPESTGNFSATLSIGNSDPTSPQKITMTGTGVAAGSGAVRAQ